MQVVCDPVALAHGGTRIHRALPRTRAQITTYFRHARVLFSAPLSLSPPLFAFFLFWGGNLSLSCAQREKFREALSAYLNCLDAFTAARKWEKSEQVMRFL